jgi:glutamate racemase
VQAVVLGCTHFVLLEQEFRTVLNEWGARLRGARLRGARPRIVLIDSREGVTRRIVSLLAGRAETAVSAEPAARSELYLHGGEQEEERYRAFAELFALTYCGQLEGMSR